MMTYNVNKKESMMKMLAPVAIIVFALTTFVGAASAQEFSVRPKASMFAPQSGNNAAANTMFSGARDLIDDAQWTRAEQKFAQYISAYPQEKNLDQAMYWMAYSQYKLRKFNQSKETLDKLLKTYEKTQWKDDAELLLAQLPGQVTVKVDPVTVTVDPVMASAIAAKIDAAVQANMQNPEIQGKLAEAQAKMAEAQARSQERTREAQERINERMIDAQEKFKDKFNYDFNFDFDFNGKGQAAADEPSEFKIVVLQALFESDPQRGIAVATEWVKPNSGQTVTCKRAALTLLARHGGKAVTPILLEVARGNDDLKVRTRAISLLGSNNDDSVIDALRDFALNSTQTEISEAAIFALSQNQSPRATGVLADIALSNKPITLRRSAIGNISNRQGEPAVDALFKIYDSSQDLEIRKSVIRGLGQRKSDRAWARLLEIARSSDNLELRKTAIGSIGRRGGQQAVDALMAIYGSEKNEEIKDQIMNSLAYTNDPKVTDMLISIAKNPQTPIERRRRIVMILAQHNKDPKVIAFLEDLLRQQ
ncbi:MAG TPA: hypothetical protein DC054_01060 [Blastocatellia bacterium]|nr:hypothetical protein [Blastocatellia bacterium]